MRKLLLLLLFALPLHVLHAQTMGTITAVNGTVTLPVPSSSTTVAVSISGTFIASITIEQSTNGTSYSPVGSTTYPTTVTYSIAVPQGAPSVTSFRARAASYLSGIVNVSLTPGSSAVSSGGVTNVNITNLPIANPPDVQAVSISGTVPVNVQNTPHVICDSGCAGGGTVAVSNFPATQAVSLATAPTTPVTGTFWQATQPVSISGTIPVTGTFWQATQPVSLASVPTHAVTQSGAWSVSVSNFPASQPVSGTFWQTTQPVSGTLAISNFPATQAVSGTFWQATQPISASSLPLPSGASTSAKQPSLGTAGTPSTDVISVQGVAGGVAQPVSLATAPTTPVTGTFWQATQPVSLASAPTTPVTGTFWQATQPVSGTFWQTTQPVSIASMPSTPVTGTFFQSTQPVSLATLPALAAGSATIGGANQVPTATSTTAISAAAKATLTASVNVKASSGNVFAVMGINGAASTCWIQFINSASAGTLGTGVIFAVPLPASTTQPIYITLPFPVNFSTGIAVGISTTATGATACGTAGNITVFFL